MKISVVTPTHNKVDLLRRTLASLEKQDLGSDMYEVVVVDDGSTDSTPRFLARHRPPIPMRVVRQEENRGRAAARNRGLEVAGGDVVVFLDDDMELAPGFLRAHLRLHRTAEKVAGVGNVSNHPQIIAAPVDRYMSTRGAQKIRNRGWLPWKYFSTNNASVRRSDLLAIGGFDEHFVHYGFEDLELAWRLQEERGIRFRFVEEARSFHIHSHSLDEVLEKKTLCGRSSLPYLFAKHPRTKRELGYERFESPRAGDPLFLNGARILYRTLFTRPVYRLVKPVARLPLGKATEWVLDYLVQYHYLEGLRHPFPTTRRVDTQGDGG